MAEEIRAEMVANVWKVVTKLGDPVEDGDTLVILESMKMEIPVLAETDGYVVNLAVAEGEVIREGDLIAVIGSKAAAEAAVERAKEAVQAKNAVRQQPPA